MNDDIIEALKKAKLQIKPTDLYNLGLCNGIEWSLAIIEGRPPEMQLTIKREGDHEPISQ